MGTRYTDNDYLLPPPYEAEDMHVLGLVLTGKKEALQKYVDKHLNIGGKHKYLVMARIFEEIAPEQAGRELEGMQKCPVLLTLHHIERLYSVARLGDESLKDRGYFRYKEAVFWVPVFEVPADNPVIITRRETISESEIADAFLYAPLILADNPLAVAGGREILGLSKRFGEIAGLAERLQADTDLDQLLSAQTFSLKTDVLQTYSSKTPATRAPIIEVSVSSNDSAGTPVPTWETLLEGIVEQALSLYDDLEVLPDFQEWHGTIHEHLVRQFLKEIRVVALKQYRRGVVDHGESCYASVNKMKATGTFRKGQIFDNLTIDVKPKNYPNISLETTMGLEEQPLNTMFYANLDSILNGDAEEPVEL